MIRRALHVISDPGLGLMIGCRTNLGAMGLLGHAMAMSRSLGDALALGLQHLALAGALGYKLDLCPLGELVYLRIEHQFPDRDIRTFLAEEAYASIHRYASLLTEGRFRVVQVDFMCVDEGAADHAREVFSAPVHFGCAENRLVFAPSQLALPIHTHHPLGLRQALELLEHVSRAERAKDDLLGAVERAVYKGLLNGVTLEYVAGELNLSSRTLRRRLAATGGSFEAVVDNVRKVRALSLLSQPEMTIDQVARETGYGDVRNFRRAFKRWTGVSPREYRQ